VCIECGLPDNICAALASFSEARAALTRGDAVTASGHFEKAQSLVESHRAFRAKILRFTLNDEQRLALSGL
jgi:hypothetical protein